jgi:hypothetical protein
LVPDLQNPLTVERWARPILFLLGLSSASVAALDLTRPLGPDETLPRCQVERTDTEFVLYVGEQAIHRFTHTAGRNIVADPSNQYGNVLLLLTASLEKLRETGICR